jgi:hypothetical protein
MTVDPLFTFNADLADVSNVHTAERVIECQPNLYQFEAPWRIELPQGGVVHGTAADAQSATWPSGLATLPPNSRVVRAGTSGAGKVVEDNSGSISAGLEAYNASVPAPIPSGGEPASGGSAFGGSAFGGSATGGTSNSLAPASNASGGCNLAVPNTPWWSVVSALALSAVALRRRRGARS